MLMSHELSTDNETNAFNAAVARGFVDSLVQLVDLLVITYGYF